MEDALSRCPKCGGEMPQGTVTASRTLTWRNPGEGILSFFMLTPFWSKSRMIAHLCRNCEIVVLEYGTAG